MARRKLKRDALWEAIVESGIFDEPMLFHDGTYWCVTFKDDGADIGYRFITIGRNLQRAHRWVERNRKAGTRYPEVQDDSKDTRE